MIDSAPRNIRRTSLAVAIALFVVGACSGSDSSSTTDGSPSNDGATQVLGSSPSQDDTTDSEAETADAPLAEPLGFDSDVFEIPIPPAEDEALGTFQNANELIDAGVAADIWNEVDGIRAVISVVMGERLPESIPALEELPKFHYGEVVDRAIDLLDDSSPTDVSAHDLARLISFFIADDASAGGGDDSNASDSGTDESGSDEESRGAYGDSTSFAPVGFRSAPMQQAGCERPQEVVLYSAEQTLVCYERIPNGDDVVFVPKHPDAVDISARIFEIIGKARPGYDSVTGRELQPVSVLVSINPSPAEPRTSDAAAVPRGNALAHVAGRSTSTCRIAIFASSTLAAEGPHLSFTIAHELFHCIQNQWGGEAVDFVEEAGADYFAYGLLDQLCTAEQLGLGARLDSLTATGSLLDTEYEGWFFWAYLSEHGHLSAQEIASLHEGIYGGGDLNSSIADALGDAPKVLNEFYARLMGPGLACQFQGSKFTSTVQITEKGPVELNVSEIWNGTRYQLEYEKKFLFEQSSDDAGPIGMAELDKRSIEGEWVTVEPEVRTTCTEKEKWVVVVSPPDTNSSSPPHILRVDAARPGGCDPCVIGSWSVDMGTYEKYMETFSQGMDVQLLGTYIFHFAGGPPDEGFAFADERNITISVPGQGAGFSFNVAGNGQGTYTALDGRLQSDGYADAGTASVTGLPVEAAVPFANVGDGGAPFTCEDDDLEFIVNGSTVTAKRMPSTPKGPKYFS